MGIENFRGTDFFKISSGFFMLAATEFGTIFLRLFINLCAKFAFAGAAQVDYIRGHDGPNIFSARTMASKSFASIPSFTASSRKVVPFLWAVLAILAARS